jgi:hypothetical protein
MEENTRPLPRVTVHIMGQSFSSSFVVASNCTFAGSPIIGQYDSSTK